MKTKHLDNSDMYNMLYMMCADAATGDHQCFPQRYGKGCPFEGIDCDDVEPAHWREVFEGKDEQEPKPEPEMPFQFGDKVTVQLNSPCEGIFNAYTDQGVASVLFEGESCCEEVAVIDLKAGWQ